MFNRCETITARPGFFFNPNTMEGLIDRRVYGSIPDNFAELTCKECGVKQWYSHPKTRVMAVINATTRFAVCCECDRLSGYKFSKTKTEKQLVLWE